MTPSHGHMFKYFNNTDLHTLLYRHTFKDYIGEVGPNSWITFPMLVPEGKGIFFKNWISSGNQQIILICTFDL